MENSAKVEELYKTATETRNFRDLSKETGKAILQEVGTQVKLPWPLPENTPEQWQNIGEETRMHNLETVRKWWALAEALPDAIQFVFPNKARADREPNTRNWTRKPGHFTLKLKFGIGLFQIQEALQGPVGATRSKTRKSCREQGRVPGTNIFEKKWSANASDQKKAREEERMDAEKVSPVAQAVGPKQVTVSNAPWLKMASFSGMWFCLSETCYWSKDCSVFC